MNKVRSRSTILAILLSAVAVVAVVAPACTGAGVRTEDVQGLLQALDGKDLVITLDNGSTVRVRVEDAAPAARAQQLVGQEIRVRVRADDRRAIDLDRVGENDSISGVIESIGAGTWVIGGKTFKVTPNTRLDGGLIAGVVARVEFVRTPDGSLTALEIETDKEEDQLTGAVESLTASSIVVAGKTFKVTPGTRIEAGIAAGVPVRVEFVTMADGSMTAIEVERENVENRLNGVLESVRGDTWVVGGKTFKVNDATRIEQGLAAGSKARVRFITLADGSMVATRIEVDKSGSGKEEEFRGAVEAVRPDSWLIGGKTFKINAATRLESGLAVGVKARVRFSTMPDGSMLASRIQVDKSG